MKSIKPGRGPSAMGAVGSFAVGLFGIFWTIGAASMGAPPFFMLFGIVFIGLAVIQGVYHVKNATGKNRMSVFEITDRHEEPDPLNRYVRQQSGSDNEPAGFNGNKEQNINFCPYCGNKLSDVTYRFCPKCGQEMRS
ncbi:zinc ribbon domain-containing protein [Paenibacillus sp. TRM 82003]|nr:zinc ribbon domain-containing protein [Paenibacillus sp. TRM 82003]